VTDIRDDGDDALELLLRALARTGPDTGTRLLELAKVLDDSPTVSYIVDESFRFVHCNPAWDHFAAANGGHGLERDRMIGADLFASIPGVLVDAYRRAFESVAAGGPVWVKTYECSSPDVFRTFQMRIHLLDRPPRWFLVTNPLVVERPHHRISVGSEQYFRDGIVTICSHCRCARRNTTPEQWDFVPEYLVLAGRDALLVSHGLCPVCAAYFYPGMTAE